MANYRLRLARVNSLKLRVSTRIPANLVGQQFITITRGMNGEYNLNADYSILSPGPIADPATAYIAIDDRSTGVWKQVTLASLLTSGLDVDLQAIAALTGTGILSRTADGAWALRTMQAPAAGLTITNPGGVAGNETFALANDLAALEGLASTGIAVRTAADTWAQRSVVSGFAVTITNGNGIAGDISVAVTDPELVALAGLASAADRLPYFTGSGTASLATFTAFGRSLVDDADASAARTTLGVVIGTDVQAFDSDLSALAANSTNGFWARTGAGTGAARTLQSASSGLTWTNGDGVAGNPVPVFTDDLGALEALSGIGVIYYRSASNVWTAVTIGSGLTFTSGTLAATGGGGSSTPSAPQGRLTLASGVPVMSGTQSAKTTIYYTPYVGNQIPLYDGSAMNMTSFPEVSVATTDTTKNPAAIGASKVNDWFVWNDSGTIRLTHGPDWTNDTTRSAGTALVMVNGILLNNAAITNGPAASRGTYVGTTRSDGSSQLNFVNPGFGTGGSAGNFAVWNCYNRVQTIGTVGDTTSTWSYTSTTIRPMNNSSNNRISFVSGLAEEAISVSLTVTGRTTGTGAYIDFFFGLDTVSARSGGLLEFYSQSGPASGTYSLTNAASPQLGYHFVQMLESGDGTNANTGVGSGTANGMTTVSRM